MIFDMEARTFTSNGKKVTTADKAEIKRLKACGWLEVKQPKLLDVWGRKIG